MSSERFPVHLEHKPPCALTEQWRRTEVDGSVTIRYAGADGYLYEKRGRDGWFRIAEDHS